MPCSWTDFDHVRLVFVDLNGVHLSKLVPVRLRKKIEDNQSELYCGVITFGPRNEICPHSEVVALRHGNGYLYPDFTTFHRTSIERVGAVLCDIHWPSCKPQAAYPRHAARLLLKRLEEKHGLSLLSAFEPEFRVFKRIGLTEVSEKPQPNSDSYVQPVPFTPGTDMYKSSLLNIYLKFFIELDRQMQSNHIHLQDFSNENGEGQLEIPMMPSKGLESADNYFILKQAIKDIAESFDMTASFMTKPLPEMISSGCHFNHSLWDTKTNRNAFFDNSAKNNLSETALHWLGGLMAHLPAILAFASPTVNCYRRLHYNLAPSLMNWDLDDRFCSIRVKNVDEKRTYVENRLASSASSPYHVLAATLAAGMDGIERKLKPPPPGQKDKNACPALPHTFAEALDALEGDTHMINMIGKDFAEWYLFVKRSSDLKTLAAVDVSKDTPYDFALERYEYFAFI